jgi:AP-4 complex subunit epsilon-1
MVLQEIVQFAATTKSSSLLRECLLLLRTLDPPQVGSSSLGRQTVIYVREFLTSENPNDVWLFLESLQVVPSEYWSGSRPECPAVLEAWEVERVMQQLQSPDIQLREMVRRICQTCFSCILTSVRHYASCAASTKE